MFFSPIRMLTLQERRLVPAHRPIKPMRGIPPLPRRHAPQNRDLFRTGFFLRRPPKFGRIANGSITQNIRCPGLNFWIVSVTIFGFHKTTLPAGQESVNPCFGPASSLPPLTS